MDTGHRSSISRLFQKRRKQ